MTDPFPGRHGAAATARMPLDPESLRRLFVEPRTCRRWFDRAVPDALIEEAWRLASMGPTSANCEPMRLVLLRTAEEKALLLPALAEDNRRKSATAPVTAVVAYDKDFARLLPRLYPHDPGAPSWFADPKAARATAFRNGTLQAGYLIVALRALGLDVGPISGFDAGAVNRTFFAGTALEANFILNIGYGAQDDAHPRPPRLALHEILVLPPGRG